MPVFRYDALSPDGRKSSGVLEAESARDARSALRDQGLTPLSVTDTRGNSGRDATSRWASERAELTVLYRVLGNLLTAGVELADALESAAQQASTRGQALCLAIRAEVVQGTALSAAIPKVIPNVPTMVPAILSAGEEAGHLGAVLLGLADHADRAGAMRSRIGIALIYPMVLVLVSMLVVMALMVHVVPEITRVFAGFQQELPILTRTLIWVSDALRDWWWILVVMIATVIGAGRAAATMAGVRRALDAVLLRVPLFSAVYTAIERERFLDTLGLLLQGAVSVQDALRASAAVMRSSHLKLQAEGVAKDVERGRALNLALQDTMLLTPVGLQLVSAGVESSRLSEMVQSAARMERAALEARLSLLLGLLEPALILMMGLFVLVIVIAILLPIFELNRLVA